jgi:predicted RNase H-like HicB family nuclease
VIGGELMSDPLRYLVVFEHSEGTGYSAWVPDLPGCIAAAETREECEQLIREAIAFHLAGMREDGDPIPEPSAIDATMVQVDAA